MIGRTMLTFVCVPAGGDPARWKPPAGRIDGFVLAARDGEVLRRIGPDLGRRSGMPVIVALADASPQALRTAFAGTPDAVLLPGAGDGASLQQLDAHLAVAEAELGLLAGSTGIWACIGESAQAVLRLDTLAGATERLRGLVWEDAPLATALGAGSGSPPVRLGRALAVLAGHAAGVPVLLVPAEGEALDEKAVLAEGFAGVLLRPKD